MAEVYVNDGSEQRDGERGREQAFKDWESGMFDDMSFHDFIAHYVRLEDNLDYREGYLDELIELRSK